MGSTREHSSEEGDGIFLMMVKSTWYTVAMLMFLCGGSVILMGIEGNYDKYNSCSQVEEEAIFNKTLREWLNGKSTGAVALRSALGVHEEMALEERIQLLDAQFDVNFTRIQQVVNLKCKNATLTLSGWDNKTTGDAVMYAASIISTVGWGRFYPKSNLCRIVTMVYAILGLPIFAAMCNWFAIGITHTERKIKKMINLAKHCGTDKIYIPLATLMISILTLINAALVFWLVEVTQHGQMTKLLEATSNDYDWGMGTSFYYTVQTVATIGFGDLYIWSPGHIVLTIKTVICVFISSFLIAMFSVAFSRMQTYFDKRVEKNVRKTRNEIRHNRTKLVKVSQVNSVGPSGVSENKDNTDT